MIRHLRKIKLTERFIVKEKVKHDYYVLLSGQEKLINVNCPGSLSLWARIQVLLFWLFMIIRINTLNEYMPPLIKKIIKENIPMLSLTNTGDFYD